MNNYGNPQPYYPGMGMQYQQPPVAKPMFRNPLTEEESKALANNGDTFNLKVSVEELGAAVCTHKVDGKDQYLTVPDQNGLRCTKCHALMFPDEVEQEGYIEDAVYRIVNVMQTIKLMDTGLDANVIRQYFACIPYIKKLPALWKLVQREFNKVYRNTGGYGYSDPFVPNRPQSVFDKFNAIANPAVPFGAGMGYPPYGAGMGYPPYGAGPAPTAYTMQQDQMMAGGSPFYTTQQQPGYAPMPGMPAPTGYGYPPQPGVMGQPGQQQYYNQGPAVPPQGQQAMIGTTQQQPQQGQGGQPGQQTLPPQDPNRVNIKEQVQL